MLDKPLQKTLLTLSLQTIQYGLQHHKPMSIKPEDYPPDLQQKQAAFVTLKKEGRLRGCIGSLIATRPLVVEVGEQAFNAAFKDPRFDPLDTSELEKLDIEISILSQPRKMHFSSENDLLGQIKPGTDGLILEWNNYKGTFLPAVWESLPNKADFLKELKRKAGLSPDFWSDTIIIKRYTSEKFSASVSKISTW